MVILQIASRGVALRSKGIGDYPARYFSDHYIEGVAEMFTEDSLAKKTAAGYLRRYIRAMRADLTYGYEESNEDQNSLFRQTADEYLRDNTDLIPKVARGAAVVALDRHWDRKSPGSFYRLMYQLMGHATRSIGGFVPYEVEYNEWCYHQRVLTGSDPTPFDTRVLSLKSSRDFDELNK